MSEEELLEEWQKKIRGIYDKHNLTCLSGMDNEYIHNERQMVSWYFDVTRKNWLKYDGKFNYHKNFDDINLCSDTVLYFTAHLFLYRPYIDNPIKNAFPIQGNLVYPNFQNKSGKRFDMFLDTTFQSLYNYWARIGDLIASFFPKIIERKKVDFVRALDVIPKHFHASQNYSWLIEFKNNQYKAFNEKRKLIVHYNSLGTERKNEHIGKHTDRNAIEKMQLERESYPEYFKTHIGLTLEGLEKTLLLLEEINSILFKEEATD